MKTTKTAFFIAAWLLLLCSTVTVHAQGGLSKVSGRAYHDCNRNGFQDGGEAGFSGFFINLTGRTALGDSINRIVSTPQSGQYAFDTLRAGNYRIQFLKPVGSSALSFVPKDAFSETDSLDSDVDTAGIATFTLDGINGIKNFDAGVIDTTAPSIVFNNPTLQNLRLGDTLTQKCDSLTNFGVVDATASDNSGETPKLLFIDELIKEGACRTDGFRRLLKISWIGLDECQNRSEFFIFIKVLDETAPVIYNTPQNISLNRERGDNVPPAPLLEALDNCQPFTAVAFSEKTRTEGNIDYITRMWVAQDTCGNAAQTMQIITLYRTIAAQDSVEGKCTDIIPEKSITLTAANCQAKATVCLVDEQEVRTFKANYTATDNGTAYALDSLKGCTADTLYSYSYFAVPTRGASPPYRLDYWIVNGVNRTISTFNSMAALKDSMNIWNPQGNWRIDENTFSIYGGRKSDNYGEMRITRLSDNAFGILQVNRATIESGLQFTFSVGNHSLILKNKTTNCSDTVLITVNCGQDTTNNGDPKKPIAVDDTLKTNKNVRIVNASLSKNDKINGDLLAVILVSNPKNGSIAFNGRDSLDYQPNFDFCGKDTFEYRVCNTDFKCDTASVFITVSCENDTTNGGGNSDIPVAVNDTFTTKKNTRLDFSVTPNDKINGTLLAVALVNNPKNGTIGFNDKDKLMYQPNTGFCGQDSFDYRVCNEKFNCDTARVYFTVTCDTIPNDTTNTKKPPVAINDNSTTTKGQSVIVNVLPNDTLNGNLDSIRIVQNPKRGTATIVGGNQIQYTPDTAFCGGNDTLSYKICNPNGCSTANLVITINCVSDTTNGSDPTKPIAIDDTLNTTKNTRIVNFSVTKNDKINGTLLAVILVTNPKNGTIAFNGRDSLDYQPNLDFCGKDTFEYRVCNTDFKCDTASVFITVNCDTVPTDTTNKKLPIAINDNITLTKGSIVNANVFANDTLNGTIDTAYISQNPKNGKASITKTGNLTYTPDSAFCGRDTLNYTICNQNGCDTASVFLNVSCDTVAPKAPIAVNDTATVKKGTVLLTDVLKNDTLDTVLDSIKIVQSPKHGTASIDIIGQLRYTPDSAYCGKDTLSYQICTSGGCDTAQVFLTIDCSSDTTKKLPIAVLDSATVNKNVKKLIDVIANDTLNGALISINIVTQPTQDTAANTDDMRLEYTPNFSVCDVIDSFSYSVCNDNGCDTAVVYIQINCVDSVIIYNSFSPNEDDRNEFFYIENIEAFPNNTVEVYNRWGNRVFEIKGYENNSERAWNGTWNGYNSPDGTYYYRIDLGEEGKKIMVGFVQLHRNQR